MRKIICTMLIALIFLLISPIAVYADDDSKSFSFELTADGQDVKEVKNGDIITVVLKLKRTDSLSSYTMYAMQDEIRYDSEFFELVDNNTVLNSGIISKDIALVDRYREIYMNYLSMSGGTQWDADMLVGSIQLRVLGKSGVTKITNQDYLVSLQDGTGSYPCAANDVTIILNTECIVSFNTNGGNEIEDQIVQYGEKINQPDNPVRDGFTFSGWYTDINLTDEWNFEDDIVESNMTLYAKWVEGNSGFTEIKYIWFIILLVIMIICYWIYRKKR